MTPLFLTAPGEERLDLFLSRELGITRSAVQKLLEDGAVTLPGEIPKKNRRTSPGEVYSVVLPEPEPAEAIPQEIPLEVVYEDGDVIGERPALPLRGQSFGNQRGASSGHRPPH